MAEVTSEGKIEIILKEHIGDRGLFVEDLKNQCTENVLLRLSGKLHNWEVAGHYLGLTISDTKAIKVDSNSEEERRIKTLNKWKEKNGDDATYYNLIEALNDSDRVDMVDQALDYLKEEIKQRADEGVDSENLQEEDIQLLCGCEKCTLDDFLKNGCPNPVPQRQFPLLNVTKLKSKQRYILVARLLRESQKVSEKFASLLCEILRCLRNREDIDVDEMALYISSLQRFAFLSEPYYTEFQDLLQEAKTKGQIMRLLQRHISWFNHDLLGSFVGFFKVADKSYEEYVENHLKPFLKKSLFEIPRKSSDVSKGSGQFVLKMSIPPPTETLSANILIPLKDQVASALGLSIESLEFCSYDDGCFELMFSAPYMLLKNMINDNERLMLVLENITNIVHGVKIQAVKFDGKNILIKSSEVPSRELPSCNPKMTEIDRMFASLVVKLRNSITSNNTHLDNLKKFICELVPQRSFDQAASIIPMFPESIIYEIDSVTGLMMFLKDYWSFFNFSLLQKLISKFGNEDTKSTLKRYVTKLQELSLQEIPILLHHRQKVIGFSSEILVATTKSIFFNLLVDDLLLVRDSIARILRIERFALLLRGINRAANQLEFLVVAITGRENLFKFSPLELSSINEAHITGLTYYGVKRNQSTDFYESDEDESEGDNDEFDDSGFDNTTAFNTSESEQEQQSLPHMAIHSSLPVKVEPLPPGLFDTNSMHDIIDDTPENPPLVEHEWLSFPEVSAPKLLRDPAVSSNTTKAKPEVFRGVQKVCALCLSNFQDESLLSSTCYDHVNHTPKKLTSVSLDLVTRKLKQVRPRPVINIKGSFQLCKAKKCKGIDFCTHAHSKLECDAWNFDLQNEKKAQNQSSSVSAAKIVTPSLLYSTVAAKSPPVTASKIIISKSISSHPKPIGLPHVTFAAKPITYPILSAVAPSVSTVASAGSQGLTSKERVQWRVNFAKRLSTVLSDQEVNPELSTSNYRDKFYYLLCFEEFERIETLTKKCDGRYKIECCQISKDKTQYICRMLGLNNDQVQHAMQSSDVVFFVDATNQLDICKGTLLSRNYSEHVFISMAVNDYRLLQAKSFQLEPGWYEVHVEFEVKHSYFNSLHQAVVSIPDSMVEKITRTPHHDTALSSNPLVTINHKCPYPDLSIDESKQLQALESILRSPSTSPSIISGPFGSGKTRIIARAAYEFIQAGQRGTNTRILLCAYNKSTIEMFISKYLGPAFAQSSQVMIIRIVKKETSNYSSNIINQTINDLRRDISQDQYASHRVLVIITTFMTSLQVAKALNKFRFTHILIDEAAQVREPEAIASLSLGDADTKVVIAGDSNQIGPSVEVLGAKSRMHGLTISLLERLEAKYSQLAGKHGSDYIYLKSLNANYRCCPDIVMFLSNTIYKYPITCGPEACLERQHPSIRYPLVFYWCDPENSRKQSLMEIVAQAVSREAKHYFSKWPREWDNVTLNDICIISPFKTQLNIIKMELEKIDLDHINLLPLNLIQGHEFQAIILTTFEPVDEDGYISNPSMSVVNPKIFNTVISRAKSFVVAIGNPLSLLKAEKQFPECCWKSYLKMCLKHSSVFFPEYYKPQEREELTKKLAKSLERE